MRKNLVIFLIIFLSTYLNSQTADKVLQSAVGKFYNFNFSKASAELDLFSRKHPNDYRGFYYKSVMNLWFFLGTLDNSYRDSFEVYSNKAASILEKIDDEKESEKVKKLFWLGMIDYNNSVISARSNDFASALVSTTSMKKRLGEVVKLNPDFYDAYLGLGLSNFAFAEVPAALKWAANLVGFDSDKEVGLSYIQLAAEKGNILKTDAQFYLSQIYSRTIIDYSEAEKILSRLVKSYPKNLLFNYSFAWIKYELNDLNAAEKLLRNIVSSNDSLFPFIISNSHLLLGNLFFTKELYDSAIVHYNLFRDKRVNNDYLGYANLRTGICFELIGNRKQALKFYEKSDEGNKDIDEDIYAEKVGKIFLQKPISEEFKTIQQIRNFIKLKNYKEAEEILNQIISRKESSTNLKANAYLLLSELNLIKKKYEDAYEYALLAQQNIDEKENSLAANSYYLSAEALFNLKRSSEAINYLNKLENIDEFDFQTILKNKAYTLLRKINRQTD
ncbi:MAG: tetratricopeptide repeat protein [Ignavibacterium sp.]